MKSVSSKVAGRKHVFNEGMKVVQLGKREKEK